MEPASFSDTFETLAAIELGHGQALWLLSELGWKAAWKSDPAWGVNSVE